MLIKDGLVFLSEDENAGFTQNNIKKCVQHYIHEIFNHSEDGNSNQPTAVQNIWDFISDHARKKYGITIEKDVLQRVHLNSLFASILEKLNITLKCKMSDINFKDTDAKTGKSNFLQLDDIEKMTPKIKDYRYQSI